MAQGDGDPVVERRGHVLLVGLNRPAKRNALDRATSESLHRIFAEANGEPCVVIVHSLTPGIFVAGSDVGEVAERSADDAFEALNPSLFDRVEAHRWPTIAVVDGPALGGGCELALACDLRVASTRARFGQPELGLGLLAGAGANWRLGQLVGVARCRRMLYAGETLDAGEALTAGLVDAVHEPGGVLEAALTLAAGITSRSWRALELTKLALRLHRPATTAFDIAGQAILYESDETRRRLERFLSRDRSGPGPAADHQIA